MMRTKRGYDVSLRLDLVGVDGLLAGEVVRIELGRSIVVGRSRKCDVSTRRSRTFLRASEEEQRAILASRSFLRVSRRHARITFLDEERVEIWDLSRNGTFVDGKRVDRRLIVVADGRDVEISLAGSERLLLRRVKEDETAAR